MKNTDPYFLCQYARPVCMESLISIAMGNGITASLLLVMALWTVSPIEVAHKFASFDGVDGSDYHAC